MIIKYAAIAKEAVRFSAMPKREFVKKTLKELLVKKTPLKDNLQKLGSAGVAVYNPKCGHPKPPLHHESVDKPIVTKRESADEYGGAISSGGSPMSTGGG